MKKTSRILITFFLCYFSYCCSSSKQISTIEAEYYSKKFDFLILHTPDKTYELHDYKFTYLTLEGKVKEQHKIPKEAIHVHLKNQLETNTSDSIVIQKYQIQKITHNTIAPSEVTILLLIDIIILLSFIISGTT